MMRPLILMLAIVPALALAQPGPFGLEDLSGRELFARFCAACHGESGRGDGPVAATMSTVVPDLTRITERYGEFAAGDIREVIDGRSVVTAHGTRTMPIWGYEFWIEEGADITAEREARILIDRLVDYLDSLQRADAAAVDGAEIFLRYCASCHGARGEGDGPVARVMSVNVPNLRSLAERNGGEFPAASVARYIDGRTVPAAHGERLMPVWGEVFGESPDGRPTDAQINIDAAVDYLRELQYR